MNTRSLHGDNHHRLFFALVPDALVRAQVQRSAAWLQATYHASGNWIAAGSYHVTLQFLGEYPQLRPDLVDAAMSVAAQVDRAGFDLVFDRAASFQGARPPWVLRSQLPGEPILQLRNALAVIADGVPVDAGQEFIPHITVLRHADKPLPPCAIEPVAWRVRDFVLLHSQPGAERRHIELGRWALHSD